MAMLAHIVDDVEERAVVEAVAVGILDQDGATLGWAIRSDPALAATVAALDRPRRGQGSWRASLSKLTCPRAMNRGGRR